MYSTYVSSVAYLNVNRKMHVTCDFDCFTETDGFLKVTASCVGLHCKVVISWKRCNTWGRCYDRSLIGRWYNGYRIVATHSNDLHWLSRSFTYCNRFKCFFSHSCVAVEKIWHRASRGPSATTEILVFLHQFPSGIFTCFTCNRRTKCYNNQTTIDNDRLNRNGDLQQTFKVM